MIFSFGGKEHQRIHIDVLGYETQTFDNFDDANWLSCRAKVSAGSFSGSFNLNLITQELVDFLNALQGLYSSLRGFAELQTLEEQIYLKIDGDGKGHMNLKGKVMDAAGIGNTLSFSLALDQTQLAQSIQELKGVTDSFPIRQA
jgi:hypothetical protein